jgi:hypothetical protein
VNLTRSPAALGTSCGPLDPASTRVSRCQSSRIERRSPDAVVAARPAEPPPAVTTSPGLGSSRPADRFRLKRIGVHDDVTQSIPLLALHVARQARSAMSHPEE